MTAITILKPCSTCKHCREKPVPARSGQTRIAQLCARSGTSTAYERAPDHDNVVRGQCGPEGNHHEAAP